MRWLTPSLLALVLLPALAAPAPAQDETSDAAAKALLDSLDAKTVTLDFEDAPVPTVIAYLRSVSKVNIVLDRAVQDELENSDTRVNLQVATIPLRSALKILCDFLNLEYFVRRGVILVSTPERAFDQTVMRVYDVRDLLIAPADYPAERRDLFALFSDSASVGFTPERSNLQIDELVEMVRESVYPDSWDHAGTSIASVSGALFVRTAREAQTEVARLLAGLRAISATRVTMTVRVVQTDAATAAALRAQCQAPPALSAAGEQVLQRAIAAGTARVISAGTLGGYNTQRVMLRDGTQRLVAAPVELGQTVVQDGLTLDVRPVLVAGRGTVHLDVNAQYAVMGPVAPKGGLPAMDAVTIETAVVGPLGTTLLLGGGTLGVRPTGKTPARETLVLLRVTTPGEAPLPARRSATPDRHTGTAPSAKLRTVKLSPDFNDTPLRVAVAFFRDACGVNMLIEPRVYDQYPEDALRVTLQVRDVSAWDALHLITDMTNLRVAERDQVVIITTRDGGTDDSTLAVYDVRDLCLAAAGPSARGPDLADGGRIKPGRMAETESEPITADQIADLIRESIDVESWDTPPNSLEPRVGMIIARNRPGVLARVERLLGDMRSVSAHPMLVEVLALDVTAEAWRAAGYGTVLNRGEAAAVAHQAVAIDGWRLVATARVAGLNAQQFTVHAGRQLTSPGPDGDGLTVAADGVVLQIRPVLAADGRQVHCDIHTRFHRADARGRLGVGLPAAEVHTSLKIPAGGAGVLGRFAAGGQPGRLLVVRVTPGT